MFVRVCVCERVLAVYNKAHAQRIANCEFKLWTFLRGTESRVAIFLAETCVMCVCVCMFVCVCECVCARARACATSDYISALLTFGRQRNRETFIIKRDTQVYTRSDRWTDRQREGDI